MVVGILTNHSQNNLKKKKKKHSISITVTEDCVPQTTRGHHYPILNLCCCLIYFPPLIMLTCFVLAHQSTYLRYNVWLPERHMFICVFDYSLHCESFFQSSQSSLALCVLVCFFFPSLCFILLTYPTLKPSALASAFASMS